MHPRALVPPCVQRPLPASGKLFALLVPIFTSLICASAPAQNLGVQGSPVNLTGPTTTRLGLTAQYKATITNNSRIILLWQVNGVVGGSPTTGTISTTGLYTAPTTLPTPNPITITAVSPTSPSVAASILDQILNPVPTVTAAVATPTATPNVFLLDLQGAGYVAGAQLQVTPGIVGPTTMVSPTELTATLTLPSGSTWVSADVLNPDPGSSASHSANVRLSTVSFATASRFLDQATFGPTLADIQHVQTIGLNAYLAEQCAAAPTLFTPFDGPGLTRPIECTNAVPRCVQSEWWNAALSGPDQLRQRVAFALSEIFVVSTDDFPAQAIIPYQNTLLNDEFGSFAKLLHDVTLTPAMGLYLDMLNNAVPIDKTQHPDENFAREVMQLFTIGINPLSIQGKPDLSQLTYSEVDVQQFALAYTGWTYANADGSSPKRFPNPVVNLVSPMAPVVGYHDSTDSKTLLYGTVLQPGGSAESDLDGALGNLVGHPNVGPFIGRQLIQHLVEGNPSPEYVERVANSFNKDPNGNRGNMQYVIQTILLDSEARAGDTAPTQPTTGGHLREPVLYVANVMRALGYTNNLPDNFAGYVSLLTQPLNQAPYASPNVFNFFHPNYTIPATILPGALNSPEFGIENTGAAVERVTSADLLSGNNVGGFTVDLSATSPLGLLATGPDTSPLVDQLSSMFMHGQMPNTFDSPMRGELIAYLNTLSTPAERVKSGIFLVISSPLYKIMQ